jgi:hypothetical protein
VPAAEDDEVIGVIHDSGLEALTTSLAPPVPEKAVHVAVGQQRADHALNAKGNFRFERRIRGWQSYFVLDLRRKR